MIRRLALPAALAAVTMLGGCTAQAPQSRVTRFHLGKPIARASVAIAPRTVGEDASLEYDSYVASVARALEAQGFRITPDAGAAELIALIEIDRTSRETGPARAPGSLGIGLGTGGGGFGIGGSIEIPIGKPRARESVRTELFVQLKRRSEGSVIWEGRAVSEAGLRADTATGATVARLAEALFRGFPGESGRTITVK